MKINHLNFPLYVMDMTNFHLNKKFNVITCFFDSINFLSSQNELKKLFDTVYSHLEDNGLFILDIFSKEMMNEYENNEIHDDYQTFKLDWTTKKTSPTTLMHTITISEDDEEFKEKYYEYYYDIKDLPSKKFKMIKLVGDFNDDLEPEDERILIVYKKIN